jgi:hypothetical protein
MKKVVVTMPKRRGAPKVAAPKKPEKILPSVGATMGGMGRCVFTSCKCPTYQKDPLGISISSYSTFPLPLHDSTIIVSNVDMLCSFNPLCDREIVICIISSMYTVFTCQDVSQAYQTRC